MNFKILHIFSGYGGGISSLLVNLIENKTNDFSFDILAFSYSDGESFINRVRKQGVEIYEMPRPRKEGYIRFLRYINQLFLNNNYDAIHCHISGRLAIPFYLLAKKNGISNIFIHAHTTRYDKNIDRFPFVNLCNHWINRRIASEYFTCSDLAAEYIFGKRFLRNKAAYLIPNGINEDLFKEDISKEERNAYMEEFTLSHDTSVLAHVGRFSPPKNQEYSLKIINLLNQKGLKVVLLFIGDGDRKQFILQKAKEYKITNNIRFVGRRQDVSKLMQFADCLVLPSLNEGLPTVAVECQAAGTPMILSDTITKQCDMGLGLLRFLSLENIELWVDNIVELFGKHIPISRCIGMISENGFTSKEAGKQYCKICTEILSK